MILYAALDPAVADKAEKGFCQVARPFQAATKPDKLSEPRMVKKSERPFLLAVSVRYASLCVLPSATLSSILPF